MLAWFWSCSGGENGARYCGAAEGSASSEIWDGAVVYTGMLEAPVVMSARVTGGE
jgi:hypothetical protein